MKTYQKTFQSNTYYTKIIWIVSNKKGQIQATWYKECKQSFKYWKKVVKSLYPDSKIEYHEIYLVK